MATSNTDFGWMSQGGILLDGTGDIAVTSQPVESIADMVRTRLKAAIDGWKLYPIGAGLVQALGVANTSELELTMQRLALNSLTSDFISASDFQVNTLRLSDSITIYVYLSGSLLATATITSEGVQVV